MAHIMMGNGPAIKKEPITAKTIKKAHNIQANLMGFLGTTQPKNNSNNEVIHSAPSTMPEIDKKTIH